MPSYSLYGADAFLYPKGNHTYSSEIKEKAVLEYLSGEGSYKDISVKYKLRSKKQLQEWGSLYNWDQEQ